MHFLSSHRVQDNAQQFKEQKLDEIERFAHDVHKHRAGTYDREKRRKIRKNRYSDEFLRIGFFNLKYHIMK